MITMGQWKKLFESTVTVLANDGIDMESVGLLFWSLTRPEAKAIEHNITKEVIAKLTDMPWADGLIKSVVATDFYTPPGNVPGFEGPTILSTVVEVLGTEGNNIGVHLPVFQGMHLRNVIAEVGRDLGMAMADMKERSLSMAIGSDGTIQGGREMYPDKEKDAEADIDDFMSKLDNVFGTYREEGGDHDEHA